MEVSKLYDLYNNNLASVMNSSLLGTIADRKYDIHGYNLVNRILIYIQNKYTTSVKGEVAWDYIGRKVKDRVSPIWVIENVNKSVFTDADSGEVVDTLELTPAELDKAVEIGTIIRTQETVSIKTIPVFNIKDTITVNKDLYKNYCTAKTRQLRLSSLLSISKEYFGINYTKSSTGKSFYRKDNDTIFIGDDSHIDKIEAIISGIYNYLGFIDSIDNICDEYSIDSNDAKIILSVLKRFLEISIISYFDDGYNVESSEFAQIDAIVDKENNLNAIVELLAIVYDTVESILEMLNPNNNEGFSEITLRKAAELLNILEANEAAKQFKV